MKNIFSNKGKKTLDKKIHKSPSMWQFDPILVGVLQPVCFID